VTNWYSMLIYLCGRICGYCYENGKSFFFVTQEVGSFKKAQMPRYMMHLAKRQILFSSQRMNYSHDKMVLSPLAVIRRWTRGTRSKSFDVFLQSNKVKRETLVRYNVGSCVGMGIVCVFSDTGAKPLF